MNADARGFNLGCHPERSEAESRDLGVPASCLLPPVSCFGMPTVFDPASYEQMSDGALLRIAMERDELTPEAGAALEAQLAKRGLKQHDVAQFADTYRAEVAEDEKGSPSRAWGFGTGFDRWPVWPSTSGTIGTVFYGRRDLKEMNNRQQYQATRWFCVLWIPLIPLGTYIVHRTTTTWLASSTMSAASARCRWIGSRSSRPGRSQRLSWLACGSSGRRCWSGRSGGEIASSLRKRWGTRPCVARPQRRTMLSTSS
jgi:hypothetical protein